MRHNLLLPLGVAVTLGAPLGGQAPTPTAIARAYFDAIVIQNWGAAAALLRTEDLERIRRESIASFQPRQIAPRTADDFLREDSTMPRVVAQYQADQFNKAIRSMPDIGGLQFEFADVKDTAQLAALPVAEVGARWIEARDQRYVMRLLLSRSPDCPKGMYSAAIASMVPQFTILGEVLRADTAWVLYRKVEHMGEFPSFTPSPSIAVLFRASGGWRIIPREHDGGASGSLSGVACDRRP